MSTATFQRHELIRPALVTAVVVFWLLAGLTEMATLYFEPIPDGTAARAITWHAWFKRGCIAIFWSAVTLLALVWYRDRPVVAASLRRHLWILSAASLGLTGAYVAYFGAMVALLSGSWSGWAIGAGRIVSLELLYVLFRIWQIAVAVNAYYYFRRLAERERERERLRLQLSEMRLMLFRAQLEPHFLFNTLNSIAALVRLRRDTLAVEALNQLGGLLRGVLEIGERQSMPWRWELAFTRSYIALQQMRFAEKLAVDIHAESIPDSLAFPVMLLQPLIENAIHHGTLEDDLPCRVDVHVTIQPDGCLISVRNPIGSRSSHGASGVGLANVAARLRMLYGNMASFDARAEDDQFVVRVLLPGSIEAHGSLA